MDSAFTFFAKMQHAESVGDFARLVARNPTTVTEEQWATLGEAGQAECATWERYVAAHPTAKRAEFDALVTKLGTDPAATKALAPCGDFTVWRARCEGAFRTTLEQVKVKLSELRGAMASEVALDAETRTEWDKDYAEVVARVDLKLAAIPKAAQIGQ